MTAIFTTVWPLKVGTLCGFNMSLKTNAKMQRLCFSKPYHETSEMLLQKMQQIYFRLINLICFKFFYWQITQHLSLKYSPELPPISSLQCHSVLSDILVKMSYAYRWKGDQMLYILLKLKILKAFLFYLQKEHFVQCYSVLSDFHPMANDDYVTWLGEFSVIVFHLHKSLPLENLKKIAVASLT